jgi:sortase A
VTRWRSDTGGRRVTLADLVAVALAVALGVGAWTFTPGDDAAVTRTRSTTTTGNQSPLPVVPAGADTTVAPPATTGTVAPGPPAEAPAAADTTTTSAGSAGSPVPAGPAPAGGLPQPEPVPADPRAPTPRVVHGTIALPTIGLEAPLHEGVTLTAIDRGPSHWPGTAMPGQTGNVVVAGHRVTHTAPFRDLDRLQVGDPLVFSLQDGSRWTYRLTATEIVGSDALWIVDQTPAPTATLFACHPKGSAAQRIVARFALAA